MNAPTLQFVAAAELSERRRAAIAVSVLRYRLIVRVVSFSLVMFIACLAHRVYTMCSRSGSVVDRLPRSRRRYFTNGNVYSGVISNRARREQTIGISLFAALLQANRLFSRSRRSRSSSSSSSPPVSKRLRACLVRGEMFRNSDSGAARGLAI